MLSPEQTETLIGILKIRFEKNMKRHEGIAWAHVQARLEAAPAKLYSIDRMEETEGEPDVTGAGPCNGRIYFYRLRSGKP